jgi:hypothetical protein
MDFQPVDRLPRVEWATWWDKTLDRWRGEGLPSDLRGAFETARYLGLDPYFQHWFSPRSQTIACADDYEAIRGELFPPHEEALERLRPWAAAQERGDAVVWITLEGFFWYPRRLFGIENHLYAFYDHAELMHRINEDLTNHHCELLGRLAKVCRPTFMTFAEDMSYNHGPMLSQQLFEEFLAPYYRRVIPLLKEMGTLVVVDTDGDVTQMVPWLESVGIEGVLPLERQAGVDAAALRANHPKLRMIGHYDKMVMTHGEEAMRAEFERLLPTVRTGGFLPSVDHQTPPGVSFREYKCYLRLLREFSHAMAGG